MFKVNSKKISIVINTTSSSLINVSPKKFSDSKTISKELLKGNVLVVDINEMTDRKSVV